MSRYRPEEESPSYRAAMRDAGRGHLLQEPGGGPDFHPLSTQRIVTNECHANRHGHCLGMRESHERCACDCHEKRRELPA